MWHVSACIVAGGSLVAGLLFVIALLGTLTEEVGIIRQSAILSGLIAGCTTFPALIFAVVLLSARTFLFLEGYISIRSLPPGAYDTVRWTNLLPHIG
jgi:hypothetical protein